MGVFTTMFSPQEVLVQGSVAEGFQGVSPSVLLLWVGRNI